MEDWWFEEDDLLILGFPTQHFWRKTLISTLRTFFRLSEFLHWANRQNHRSLIIQTPSIETNGLNFLIVRNVDPYIHGNPIVAQR